MIDLFEKLPEQDKDKFWNYLRYYSNGDKIIPKNNLNYYLRYWNENKQALFKAFNNQFILKKEIKVNASDDFLRNELDKEFYNSKIITRFICEYKDKCHKIGVIQMKDWDLSWMLQDFVCDNNLLIQNCYIGDRVTIPGDYTQDGRALTIQSGVKAIKMLGKIAAAIDAEMPIKICKNCGNEVEKDHFACWYCGSDDIKETTGYEIFRQAHAKVMTKKKICGNLCLSIHPLDYVTMSDNDLGWHSCMRWRDDPGDYRLGTIEMMNSPSVIVAYLEDEKEMELIPGEGEFWSNKRWRQLFIANNEAIIANRQYPYDLSEIEAIAIDWIKFLVQEIGYGPFPNNTIDLENDCYNTIQDRKISFSFCSNYMYNDIYDYRLAYIASQKIEGDRYYHNFSGPAICSGCGEDIGRVEPNSVECRKCGGYWVCDYCGDYVSGDAYEVDGQMFCIYCYERHGVICEHCETAHIKENTNNIYIQLVDTTDDFIKNNFNYTFCVTLCNDCLNNFDSIKDDYGPIYIVKDYWGNERKAFDIRNITDEALAKGVSQKMGELLHKIKECDTEKEIINLIKSNLF